MGQCCSQDQGKDDGNCDTSLYPTGATLDGRHYSAKQVWTIVRIQAAFRMYMAKKRVSMLRHEIYTPGMAMMGKQMDGSAEDFDNINVQVSDFHSSFLVMSLLTTL